MLISTLTRVVLLLRGPAGCLRSGVPIICVIFTGLAIIKCESGIVDAAYHQLGQGKLKHTVIWVNLPVELSSKVVDLKALSPRPFCLSVIDITRVPVPITQLCEPLSRLKWSKGTNGVEWIPIGIE